MASAVVRRLAKAHRSTRNDHVHRNAQLGSRRSEQITFGIIPKLSKRDSEGGFPDRRVSDSRWRAQEVRHGHSTSG